MPRKWPNRARNSLPPARCKFFWGGREPFFGPPIIWSERTSDPERPQPLRQPASGVRSLPQTAPRRGFLFNGRSRSRGRSLPRFEGFSFSGHASDRGTFGPPHRIDHVEAGRGLELGGKSGIV